MNTDRRGFLGALLAAPFLARFGSHEVQFGGDYRVVLNSAPQAEAMWTESNGRTHACIMNVGPETIRVRSLDFKNRRFVVERGL